MTKEFYFGLVLNRGVNLDDAVRELTKFYKEVVVRSTTAIGRNHRIECKSPQDAYERLSNTKLVEQTCEYTEKSSGQKKTHKYLTNDKKPEVDKDLRQYFAGIDSIEHNHASNDLAQSIMDKLKELKGEK